MTDIRPMSRSDIPAVAQLAAAQLYNSTADELFPELQKAMRNPQQAIFLALSGTRHCFRTGSACGTITRKGRIAVLSPIWREFLCFPAIESRGGTNFGSSV